MTDDIDRAQARQAELLQDALRDQARRARRGLGAQSARHCSDCGDPIPPARRQALPGVQRCLACQARREQTPHGTHAR